MKKGNIEIASVQGHNNEPDARASDLKGQENGEGIKDSALSGKEPDDIESSAEASQDEISIVLIAVRFRPKWPPFHYNAGNVPVMDAEWVVVPTEHGIEVGRVMGRPVMIRMSVKAFPPKVERLASTHEIELYYNNLDREKAARDVCAESIRALGLSMKLVRVESFFDGTKIVFYYSAEGRVDFRELVKDLVKALQTRVEMHQIGIRHETKMIGGIGNCGREICCASFLKDFDPVFIKMAKSQNLPLNPNKISGICGRLLCCLTYENETYLELAKGMPLFGKPCDTPAGQGKLVRQDILRQTITVALSDDTQVEFKISELEQHRLQKKKRARFSTRDSKKQIKTDRSIAHSPKQKRSESKPGAEKKRPEHSTAPKDSAGWSKGDDSQLRDKGKEKNLKARCKNKCEKKRSSRQRHRERG
jgi:cell fate regulator YaaT (PSP1 superfamily)